MSDKVSGFCWCSSVLGHKYVSIYKNANSRYCIKIDCFSSTKSVNDFNDIKGIWECVAEVEKDLIEFQELVQNDKCESKPERRGSVCPEPII